MVRYCHESLVVQELPLVLGTGPRRVWFGVATGHSFPTGAAAAPTDDGYVIVRATPQPQVVERVDVKTTADVFGVGLHNTAGALWAVSKDRLQVLAVPFGDGPAAVVAVARTPIEQALADSCSSRLAWREQSGRLVVLELSNGKALLDLQPEAG